MKKNIRAIIRDLIPTSLQVPIKYWYCYFKGMLEPEMHFIKLLVPPKGHAIDVGGNRGIYSYKLNLLDMRVDAFEPNPECYEILNAWGKNKKKVTIHQIALSNSSGSANLNIPIDDEGTEHDSSATIESVDFKNVRHQIDNLQTLDSFNFSSVDFIKVDVEGHESTLIDGALKTISSNKPVLLMEIEQRHNKEDISEIFNKITAFNYKGYFLKENKFYNLEKFIVKKFQSLEQFGDLDSYINNFFFLHADRVRDGEYRKFLNFVDKN